MHKKLLKFCLFLSCFCGGLLFDIGELSAASYHTHTNKCLTCGRISSQGCYEDYCSSETKYLPCSQCVLTKGGKIVSKMPPSSIKVAAYDKIKNIAGKFASKGKAGKFIALGFLIVAVGAWLFIDHTLIGLGVLAVGLGILYFGFKRDSIGTREQLPTRKDKPRCRPDKNTAATGTQKQPTRIEYDNENWRKMDNPQKLDAYLNLAAQKFEENKKDQCYKNVMCDMSPSMSFYDVFKVGCAYRYGKYGYKKNLDLAERCFNFISNYANSTVFGLDEEIYSLKALRKSGVENENQEKNRDFNVSIPHVKKSDSLINTQTSEQIMSYLTYAEPQAKIEKAKMSNLLVRYSYIMYLILFSPVFLFGIYYLLFESFNESTPWVFLGTIVPYSVLLYIFVFTIINARNMKKGFDISQYFFIRHAILTSIFPTLLLGFFFLVTCILDKNFISLFLYGFLALLCTYIISKIDAAQNEKYICALNQIVSPDGIFFSLDMLYGAGITYSTAQKKVANVNIAAKCLHFVSTYGDNELKKKAKTAYKKLTKEFGICSLPNTKQAPNQFIPNIPEVAATAAFISPANVNINDNKVRNDVQEINNAGKYCYDEGIAYCTGNDGRGIDYDAAKECFNDAIEYGSLEVQEKAKHALMSYIPADESVKIQINEPNNTLSNRDLGKYYYDEGMAYCTGNDGRGIDYDAAKECFNKAVQYGDQKLQQRARIALDSVEALR